MDATILETIARAGPEASPAKVRSMCGAFMFSGDDVDKLARVLSGGERARVALAKLCVAPGSLLLMDEPTNHLDLWSSEALAESLATFDGTLVFVSHNRSLIRRLATRIWNVEGGRVETYPGTLDEYMYSMAQRRQAEVGTDADRGRPASRAGVAAAEPVKSRPKDAGGAARSPGPPPGSPKEDDKTRRRREAEARQKKSAKLGPLENQVAQLEARIETLEAEQKVRSAELADPTVYGDAARRNKLLADFQAAQDKLEELTSRWEKAAAELETARVEHG
jgi:ATP-binding cassette subfamily F protein 3